MIKTWYQRLEEMDDGHITTHADVRNAQQAEIDELRAEVKRLEAACNKFSEAELLQAQPVQEPAGWTDAQMIRFGGYIISPTLNNQSYAERLEIFRAHEQARGYAAPAQPVQERAYYEEQPDGTVIPVDPSEMQPVQSPPLTDAEIVDAIEHLYQNRAVAEMAAKVGMDDYRAIEAALKGKP